MLSVQQLLDIRLILQVVADQSDSRKEKQQARSALAALDRNDFPPVAEYLEAEAAGLDDLGGRDSELDAFQYRMWARELLIP